MAAPKIRMVLTAEDRTRQAISSVKRNLTDLSDTAATLRGGIQGALVSVASGLAVGKLVAVQREFDVLNASMVTMTGSSIAAEKEFAWLKEFAEATPFTLNEVSQAFIKMKGLGLDPSRESLEALGNTAAAKGKDLLQFIEAVADASNGEFERLKEFDIKASKQGDEISLTFQGVTKTIKNSAEEIVKSLEEIGRTKFAGAMAERAKTLDGALIGLGRSWDELFRTINAAGVGQLIFDATKLANEGVQNLINNVKVLGQYTNPQGQMRFDLLVGERSTLQENLAGLEGRRGDVAATARADIQRRIDKIDTELRAMQQQRERREAEDKRASSPPATPGKANPDASKSTAKRAANYIDPLADEAKAYEKIMLQLTAAQRDADTAGLALTATQQKLLETMSAPEWLTMTDAMRAQIAQQGEATIAAEQRAAAEKRLQGLLTDSGLERQRADMQMLAQAYEDGRISVEQYSDAVQRSLGNVPATLDKTAEGFESLKASIEGWGKDAARAIVDFAITGKSSFSDMINSIIADLARMVVQKNITAPLAAIISGADYAAMGSAVAGFFGFADGGVMTAGGPLPLRAYAAGGVASSPQLALFGEGSRPEAFVPLPDGRSIPVTMRGAGAAVQVVVHNNAGAVAQASATATQDSAGNTQINIMVERVESMMGRRIQQGGGLAPMLENRYGLNPAAGARF